MIGSSRADVECPAGCDALVTMEVARDGRARARGHCCMRRPCAGEREALAALFGCERADEIELDADGRGVVLAERDDRPRPSSEETDRAVASGSGGEPGARGGAVGAAGRGAAPGGDDTARGAARADGRRRGGRS
jgi:hypothetical protein